jgi:hypothetical protein
VPSSSWPDLEHGYCGEIPADLTAQADHLAAVTRPRPPTSPSWTPRPVPPAFTDAKVAAFGNLGPGHRARHLSIVVSRWPGRPTAGWPPIRPPAVPGPRSRWTLPGADPQPGCGAAAVRRAAAGQDPVAHVYETAARAREILARPRLLGQDRAGRRPRDPWVSVGCVTFPPCRARSHPDEKLPLTEVSAGLEIIRSTAATEQLLCRRPAASTFHRVTTNEWRLDDYAAADWHRLGSPRSHRFGAGAVHDRRQWTAARSDR